MASSNTSTVILVEQALFPPEDPKVFILPWLIGTMVDNLLQGGYPQAVNRVWRVRSLTKPHNQVSLRYSFYIISATIMDPVVRVAP
jgi:hypothetical protein